MNKLSLGLAGILMLAAPLASQASANAEVSWGTPTDISGDTDVNTGGALVMAYHFGAQGVVTSTTVNGVTFAAFGVTPGASQSATVGNLSLFENQAGHNLFAGAFTTGSAPFSALTANYQALVGSMVFSSAPGTLFVNMSGLTPGQDYFVQLWTNFSAGPTSNLINVSASPHPANVTLDVNTTNATGGLGQWVTGTFTAAGSVQGVSINGTQAPYLSGMQVRAVPEPGVTGLVGAVLAGLVVAGWRKKRS